MSTSTLLTEKDVTFHRFSDLPAELRLMIWRCCLPHRVVELDDQVYYGGSPSPCGLSLTTFLNGKPGLIARVCRESRHVAQQSRSIISEKDMPEEASWWSHTRIEKLPPIDPSRAMVHLNWEPTCNEYADEDSSAHHLAWYAGQVARGGSLMIDNLSVMALTQVKALTALPRWMVVMRVIFIHARPEYAAKTGLFGLLGDELVQIIEVSDEARINAYFDLANESQEKGHVQNPQNLRREPVEAVEQSLKQKTTNFRRLLDPMPDFRATIMFRLCPDMCNHTPDADEEFRPLPEPAPPPRPLWLRRGQGWIRSRTRGRLRSPQEMDYPFRRRRIWG
ncbi:hypothetical protein PISL3812_08938 [Talaromyces islandicus]|uniref:2EXR domain-containing protein n=1 Tax=Talaromyces islandicus TaxID=28573 RepID=A0A0U1M8C2_TALIS|nr:hypothetical protein PISL3812_08938 [Talaromyces islandicus]